MYTNIGIYPQLSRSAAPLCSISTLLTELTNFYCRNSVKIAFLAHVTDVMYITVINKNKIRNVCFHTVALVENE